MPLTLPNRTVSLHGISLPEQPVNSQLPANTQLINLIGGLGGNVGEKSYKPQVQFSIGTNEGDTSSPLDVQTNGPFYTKELKEENDCGNAIKILYSNSNKSEVNINYLNSNSDVDIYTSSERLKFSTLYSGVAQSKTAGTNLTNGTSVDNFTILTDGTETVSVVQDTELGLNKNYLDFTSATVGDYSTKFLKKNVSEATESESIFNVFVSEIDVNPGYVSYITSPILKNSLSLLNPPSPSSTTTSLMISIQSGKLFSNGDFIRVQDLSNPNNFAIGTVTSYSTTDLTVTFNLRYTQLDLPAGSSVCIENINNRINSGSTSHCISTIFTDVDSAETYYSLRIKYATASLFGFRFTHERSITNNNIIDYSNEIRFLRNSFRQDKAEVQNELVGFESKFNRIGNRNYLKSQYNGKDQLISKNKFSIISYGFYKQNDSYRYFNGYYKNFEISGYPFDSLLVDPKNYLLTVGNGAAMSNTITDDYKPYYTHKLYEILSYRNLQYMNTYEPQKIIIDNLISKYKEKAFFSNPSEIQTTDDIYYSAIDRPNILGKVRKIIL